MCLAVSVIAGGAAGQFASGISLVEVYATVVDQRGEPVTGLEATDFRVEEDGRVQRIDTFAAGEFPLALAIAVDHSFSVPRERLREMVYAVQRLLGELRTDDQVLLLAIGSQVEEIGPLSTDHRAAYEALRDLQPWGTTPLFDATLGAIDAIQAAPGRRALILLSDGTDRYSTVSAGEMIAQARRRDVLVYPVVIGRTMPSELVEVAAVTGGRAVIVSDVRQLSTRVSAIARELRSQYLLGYAPSEAGATAPGWRAISVSVTRRDLRVRAREGYYTAAR